jgi:hypothetical protein
MNDFCLEVPSVASRACINSAAVWYQTFVASLLRNLGSIEREFEWDETGGKEGRSSQDLTSGE